MSRISAVPTRLSLGVIRVYKYTLGPVLGMLGGCRYQPTCSVYGYEAIRRFGWRRGWALALRRIGRCAPWGGSGYDPVPDTYTTWREQRRLRQRGEAAP